MMRQPDPFKLNDDELYSRYLSGETKAGDELMLRYADQLTAYLCSILNNPQDAEDLMLESFSVILVDKPGIREGCFKAWLFKTARNKAISLWRRILQRNEFSLSEELADTLNGLTGLTAVKEIRPEEKVLEGERNTGLHNAMSRIAPQYREALWLVYAMEMSCANAASVLGCGVKRVENLLYNGKARLRAELEKEGITNADI